MSIVERLRQIAKSISAWDLADLTMRIPADPDRDADLVVMRAADLIEQQAARIAELEAAMPLYDELLIRCAIAEKDLAALRKRIDDAPVVVVNVGASYVLDRPGVYRLIIKEDLQK